MAAEADARRAARPLAPFNELASCSASLQVRLTRKVAGKACLGLCMHQAGSSAAPRWLCPVTWRGWVRWAWPCPDGRACARIPRDQASSLWHCRPDAGAAWSA